MLRARAQDIETGRLIVSALSTDPAIPLNNARIRIYQSETNLILRELWTNSVGQTEPFELGAPPIEYSQTTSGARPYSTYRLQADAAGFQSVVIDGVQILPESTALQNVQLQTEKEEPVTQTLSIEDHTLWGNFPPKIEEPSVKPLPDAGGYIVLPEPVIPEYIVVHLGKPTDSAAQNVWVPFRDYVKNVASSEIYSTWPQNAIRANVLAILSFALNRVYTEWYRGKGFSFTITNSTAFDQAFVLGRNIFQEISVIVDQIFTTYVTKPGIRQPLLTQFCDGNKAQCPNGMEQWGSKYLADQGYDSLSILRNYYGSNIYLKQAEKVSGVPMSFPGTTLQIGSTGKDVRVIQDQLNSISNKFPLIPKLKVDGIYGEQTASAVKTFQEIFHLPVTGVVDFATWYAISNIYVGVTQLAEL